MSSIMSLRVVQGRIYSFLFSALRPRIWFIEKHIATSSVIAYKEDEL